MSFSELPLTERKERLDLTLGVPTTPVGVANRMIDLTRQTGRTMELVRALPADGKAIVFGWTRNGLDHIKHMIREHRGPDYPVKKVKFLVYDQFRKGDRNLAGLESMPAFIDNQVFDMLSIEIAGWVNGFFERKPK
jgi:hypothetical protein